VKPPLLVPLPDPPPLDAPLDPPLLVPPPEPLAMLPLLVPPPDPLVPLLVPLDPPLPEPPPSSDSPWLPEDPHRVTTKARATRDVTRSIDCTFMNVRLPESSSRRRLAVQRPCRWEPPARTPSHLRMPDTNAPPCR
jgi:hypothetical protein